VSTQNGADAPRPLDRGGIARRVRRAPALHPWAALGTAIVVTLVAAVGIARLRFDNSSERLLVQDTPDAAFLEETRRTFGGDEILFVLLAAPDAVAPDAVRTLARLSEAVRGIDGVERVASLDTLRWPWPKSGDVVIEHLFAPDGTPRPGAPVTAALTHPLVDGSLVTRDRRVAAVLASVRPRPDDPRFKGRLVAAVEEAVAAVAPQATVLLGGAPYGQVQIDALTRHDLRLLGSLAFVAMAILLAITYRSVAGVALPLLTVLLSLVWTLGVAGFAGLSLSVITSVLIPLVLAIGTSYCVRVVSEHRRQLALGRSGRDAVAAALDEVGATVLLCGATTALGFLPLCGSRIDVVRDLGTLSVAASVLATLAALTVVPGVLALARARPRPAAARRDGVLPALLLRIHTLTERRTGLVLGAGALLLVVGIAGLLRLRVDQNPYEWFPPGSPVARSTQLIDQQLGGVLPFSIVLHGPDGAWDPALLRANDALTAALRADPQVRAAASFSDFVRLVATAFQPGADGALLPQRADLIAQYAFLYDLGDVQTLAPYVSPENGRQQVLVRLAHASTSEVQAFLARLDGYIAALVAPPLEARVTGTGLLRVATAQEFAAGLFRQLGLASLAIAVLLSVALRSPALGVLALVPNLLPILLVYGLLGLVGIPLNVATVTTGAAALGNAVDDTVQYLDRYRRLRPRHGADARRATLEAVGQPMIVSDVVLAVGFAVLLGASFFPVASLGMLGATAMAFSLVGNLFLLPALVALWERRTP
jgi:predicted RND superfamily exporter protein